MMMMITILKFEQLGFEGLFFSAVSSSIDISIKFEHVKARDCSEKLFKRH